MDKKMPPAPAGPPELEPDLRDVLQVEAPLAAMPVRIEGPVRVQELPARDRTARTISVGDTAFVQLLTADPYRKVATVQAFDQDVYLSYAPETQVGDPTVQRVAEGTLITITARTYVGVASVTGTAIVALAQERLANAEW
jgi:hypothetical protein